MFCETVVSGIIVLLALNSARAAHLSRTSAGQGAWLLLDEKQLPGNIVAAGYEGGATLYACRANSIAGYTYNNLGQCHVGHGNTRYDLKSHFEVLVDFTGVWVPLYPNSSYPNNSFVVSYQSTNEPVYYGRNSEGLMGSVYNRELSVADNYTVLKYTSDYEIYTSVPEYRVVGFPHYNPRYRFIGNYMTFRVKADPSVEIALVLEGGNVPIFMKLGNKKLNSAKSEVVYANMDDFISPTEYNGFWLYREGDTINLGVEGNSTEQFSFEFEGVSNISKVKFISIGKSYWYLPRNKILDTY